jgi:hypothetical protein
MKRRQPDRRSRAVPAGIRIKTAKARLVCSFEMYETKDGYPKRNSPDSLKLALRKMPVNSTESRT